MYLKTLYRRARVRLAEASSWDGAHVRRQRAGHARPTPPSQPASQPATPPPTPTQSVSSYQRHAHPSTPFRRSKRLRPSDAAIKLIGSRSELYTAHGPAHGRFPVTTRIHDIRCQDAGHRRFTAHGRFPLRIRKLSGSRSVLYSVSTALDLQRLRALRTAVQPASRPH